MNLVLCLSFLIVFRAEVFFVVRADAGLREKLNKIMASDYFTATPQMKGPGEVAAAAAVGNFGSFQVPVQESMVPVEVPVQIEGSAEQYADTVYIEYRIIQKFDSFCYLFNLDKILMNWEYP